jgi:cell filamentation protein, protein adenylyltransferase
MPESRAYSRITLKKTEKPCMSHAAQPFDPSKPHNKLPPLPPMQETETKPILKKCVVAGRALATLQQAAKLIPNQDVLINTIPLREAKDSSAIENIVTTNDKLFRYASVDPEKADNATKETLRYRTALFQGYRDIQRRPLTTNVAISICRAIKNVELDVRKTPGTSLRNQGTGQVIYTPPEGEAVLREKLANWERYLHEATEVDPLIRMAVAHYQFEAIHPFPDGNGRTGRIINLLFLIEQGLLDLPVLYLSRYISDNRAEYYRLLLEVTTKAAWEAWILYMLLAVEETSMWTVNKVMAIRSLMDETVRHVSTAMPKIYSRELVELIFTRPYCRIGNLIDAGIGNRNTAAKYLKELTVGGVLDMRKEGRDQLYINSRFLDLLLRDTNEFGAFAAT